MSLVEIVIILALGLVVLGPEKIPEVAKFAGKAIREIRKASNLLRDAMVLEPDPTPKRRSAAIDTPKAKPASFDQTDPFPETNLDPSPERNIQVVRMRERAEPSDDEIVVNELDLQKELFHREVYLHIPYEETI